ncbi:MAG: T9SS type A sorting domain-containing protein, partial [Bacteroidota bacterium]
LKAQNVAARLLDLSGNELWSKDIRSGYDGHEEIDVSGYNQGIYILQVFDKDKRDANVISYRILVGQE